MDDRPWLRELALLLARQGLPRRYTERLLEELSDHFDDLMEEEIMRASESANRLGSAQSIAAVAARQYRSRRFASRHPRIVFLLFPIVLLPVLWAAALVGMVTCSDWLGLEAEHLSSGPATSSASQTTASLLCRAAIVLPAIIATLLFYGLSRRATLHWRWPMFAWALLGLLAGCAWVDLSLNPAGQRALLFAFGITRHTLTLQSAQMLAPLALGGLLLWRDARFGKQLCTH